MGGNEGVEDPDREVGSSVQSGSEVGVSAAYEIGVGGSGIAKKLHK